MRPITINYKRAYAGAANNLPTFIIRFPPRRWRLLLRGKVSPSAIRLLSRARQRKLCNWLDLTVRDFAALQHLGVLPEGDFVLTKKDQ
jgi:hypothetical protein